MGNAFSEALKPYDLSLTEWRVCASLHISSGQTLSELATNTATKISAISRLLDRLVLQGIVQKSPCDKDKRAVRMYLTKQGDELTESIIPLAQYFESVALKGLSTTEIKTLETMLEKIYNNAQSLE